MKRKIIIFWLCILTALLPMAAGGAEEAAPAEPGDVWVMYVPVAENGSAQQIAAQYAAQAVMAARQDRTVHTYKTVATKIDTERNIFSGGSFFNQSAQNQSGWDGTGRFLLAGGNVGPAAGKAHEIWLIVPAAAAGNVARNSEWMAYFSGLLAGNEASGLHVVFIGRGAEGLEMPRSREIQTVFEQDAGAAGEDTSAAGENTAADDPPAANPASLAELAAAYPGRADWMIIREQFGTPGTGDISVHSGDYLIAALAGKGQAPLDLEIDRAGDGEIRFTLPGQGARDVLVLAPGAGSLTVKDGINPVTGENLTINPVAKQADKYLGIFFNAVGGSEYTVETDAPDALKVYWYPDFDAVAPQLQLGTAKWEKEDHEIRLQAADILNKAADGFSPVFSVLINDTPVSAQDYRRSEDGTAWILPVVLDENTEKVTAGARLQLVMKDGNLAAEWAGQPREIPITIGGIDTKANEQPERTIYQYGSDLTKIIIGAEELYDFPAREKPEFEVSIPGEAFGLRAEYDRDIRKFTVAVDDSIQAAAHAGEPVNVKFSYGGGLEQEITVRMENADRLLQEWIDITLPENAAEFKAGSPVPVSVAVSPENLDEYRKVFDIITASSGINFPDPGELKVRVNGKEGEEQPLAEAEGGLALQPETAVPADAENGSSQPVRVEVLYQGLPVKTAETTLVAVNTPPKKNNSLKARETVGLDGIPLIQEYGEADLLDALGMQEPYTLFTDEETDVRSVTLTIEGTQGLKLEQAEEAAAETADPEGDETGTEGGETAEAPAEDETQAAPEAGAVTEGNTWSFTVTRERPKIPARILVKDSAEYTITLTAEDGANEPVKQTVKVQVEPKLRRPLLIAAAVLAGLLAALTVFLVIRQARKPKFGNIRIRCLLWNEEGPERAREVLNKSKPVSMTQYGKNPASLNAVLVLTRQPALSPDLAEIAEDITLLPTRLDELVIVFGKKAMAAVGRQDKKVILTQGNPYRIRLGNQYLTIEKA